MVRGERLDQPMVLRVGLRLRPGQGGDLGPGSIGRPVVVHDPVGRLSLARPMMTGHAMIEDRLKGGVGENPGGFGHLVETGV